MKQQPSSGMPDESAREKLPATEGWLVRAVSGTNKWVGETSGVIYFVVFAICLMEILLRFFFNAPTSWAFEVTIALCGIQYCLAGGNTHRLGRHIRIDAIYLTLPVKVRNVLDVVSEIVISLALASIVYGSGIQSLRAVSAWQTTGSAFNSPAPTFMKVAITVGAVLILLQSLVRLGQALCVLSKGRKS